ncbi:MAG: M56 family metallopeptidase [Verrucomicrobiales bacterium]
MPFAQPFLSLIQPLVEDWLMRSFAISVLAVLGLSLLNQCGATVVRSRFLFTALVMLLLLPLVMCKPSARVTMEIPWGAVDLIPAQAQWSGSLGFPVLSVIWGIGCCIWVGMLVTGLLQLRRQLANAKSLDVAWSELVAECTAAVGLRRRPRLVMTNSRAMPCAIGILRPTIVLPKSALAWDLERRRMVLLHEMGHMKRGDLWLQWISLAVRGMYWFNPLVKSLHKALLIHREEACDALVVASGARPSIYARHLLEIASTHQQASSLSPALAMASDDHPTGVLEKRIRRLLDGERQAKQFPGSRLVAGGFLALCFLLAIAVTFVVPAAHRQAANGARASAVDR